MKAFLTAALILISFNSFSSDNLTIKQAIDSGYTVRMTVSKQLGIAFAAGEITGTVSDYCQVRLAEETNDRAIIRNGRPIDITSYYDANTTDGNGPSFLYSDYDQNVESVIFHYDFVGDFTIAQLEDLCIGFEIELVNSENIREL